MPGRDSLTIRRRLAAFVVIGGVVVAGCSGSDDVTGVDEPTDGVAGETFDPALDDGPRLIDPDSEGDETPTTATPTDPADDRVAATPEDGALLRELLEHATDPVTGTPVSELELTSSELPERWSRNSRGAEVRLDEAALLACANDQFAWVELESDAPDAASDWLAVAAARARQSKVDAVASRANDLAAAWKDPVANRRVVDEFLALCLERGFEV